MKNIAGILLLLIVAMSSIAQSTLVLQVKDRITEELLPGTTMVWIGKNRSLVAGENGIISISGIPDGKQEFSFNHTSYEEHVERLNFPRGPDTLVVYLRKEEDELNTVIISSTRSSRTIKDIPTRIELIAGEELSEKANMKPGDIRMLLNESTGIQTQQVSATSANASIRIQGLDGRYTQMLKDGFPLYGGFSNGLGLLQTPILDLKQVEVIKGASSTLYGGGAIAGLVNLISKTPGKERELKFLVNGTSAGGLDLSAFYSQQFSRIGVTVFAAQSLSKPYDPSGTGFTAIPKTNKTVLNPRLFFALSPKTRMTIGMNAVRETRNGGDLLYVKGKGDSVHSYFEENQTQRISSQFTLEHRFSEKEQLTFKNSVSGFSRSLQIPDYVFDGDQLSTYTEIAYHREYKNMDWVLGANLYTDRFEEHPKDAFPKRDYRQTSFGGFIQNTWKVRKWLQVETGLRADQQIDYGFVVLPNMAALFRISPKLSSRLSGGLGYKPPTLFTEETERIHYRFVQPIDAGINQLEKSYGANLDVNYRTTIADNLKLSVNQLFFFTRIDHPLLLEPAGQGQFSLVNSANHYSTRGLETNLKAELGNFKLFLGYTFTDAKFHEQDLKSTLPLTARHRLNNVLMFEIEDKWRLGAEAYYYSSQLLNDGKTGKPYWTFGFMAEKIWTRLSVFVNFENFTDTRQTRFDTIYYGTITHPVFRDIYAPLDGFVVNGGIKLNL